MAAVRRDAPSRGAVGGMVGVREFALFLQPSSGYARGEGLHKQCRLVRWSRTIRTLNTCIRPFRQIRDEGVQLLEHFVFVR